MVVVDILYSPLAHSNYHAIIALSKLTISSLKTNIAFIGSIVYFASFILFYLVCWILESSISKEQKHQKLEREL